MALVLGACSLVNPTRRDEYDIISVNGDSIAKILETGTIDGGVPTERRVLAGRLTLFEGGRWALRLTTILLVNGAPDARFPEYTSTRAGDLSRRDTTLDLGHRFFTGYETEGGRLVRIRDITGTLEFAWFEFERR